MKKITKSYLTFCGINSVLLYILSKNFYLKLKEDGYIIKNQSNMDSFIKMIESIILLVIPIYNVISTTQFLLILGNKDLYNIVKNRLISKNIIVEENTKSGIDDSNLEEVYRGYRKATQNLNNENVISEPFREILDEMKEYKVKEMKK